MAPPTAFLLNQKKTLDMEKQANIKFAVVAVVAVGILAAMLYLLARVIGFVMLHISIHYNVPL